MGESSYSHNEIAEQEQRSRDHQPVMQSRLKGNHIQSKLVQLTIPSAESVNNEERSDKEVSMSRTVVFKKKKQKMKT